MLSPVGRVPAAKIAGRFFAASSRFPEAETSRKDKAKVSGLAGDLPFERPQMLAAYERTYDYTLVDTGWGSSRYIRKGLK